ncbi:sulfatase [Pelagicoccus mobilis]
MLPALVLIAAVALGENTAKAKPLNVLYIMSDDHAAHAVGSYGGRLSGLNPTPVLDSLADEGLLFENVFVNNSICIPSRASIISGQYPQTNTVLDLDTKMPFERQYLPNVFKDMGYQTALIGKWHLGVEPDFDYWKVMVAEGEQGTYFDPDFQEIGMTFGGTRDHPDLPVIKTKGHSSDVITDLTLEWLENGRDKKKPFFLMHHYKAPHDMFENAPRYDEYLEDEIIPEPSSLYSDPYWGSEGTRGYGDGMRDRIGTSVSARHNQRHYVDLLNGGPTTNPAKDTFDAYQTYVKRYLRCVKGVDDNLNRLFEYLKKEGLWENTIIVYTSDQGMMLGEHDLQDKRWIYEESIHMPFIVRHPKAKYSGLRNDMMISNTDFGPTLIELAGGKVPSQMQGRSFASVIETGKADEKWDDAVYYRYWMHMIHHDVPAHFGIRTKEYKLIFYYGRHYDEERMGTKAFHWLEKSNLIDQTPVAWELYDMVNDPEERVNLYGKDGYEDVTRELKQRLKKMREDLNETDEGYPKLQAIIDTHWDK